MLIICINGQALVSKQSFVQSAKADSELPALWKIAQLPAIAWLQMSDISETGVGTIPNVSWPLRQFWMTAIPLLILRFFSVVFDRDIK
jgi:hypothetical protein